MKKIVAIVLGVSLLGLASPFVSKANDEEKAKPTEEQKKVRKEMLEKYDANKDGKLDKDERAKISAEDKAKLEKAGVGQGRKEGEKKRSDKKK